MPDDTFYYRPWVKTQKLEVDGPASFSEALLPLTDDVAALGSTSLKWSDLFLADGAVINFNSGNVTLTHSAGALTLNTTTKLQFRDTSHYIQSDAANDLMINAGTNLMLAIGGTDEVHLTASALSPATSDGNALGTTALMWSDLFLASGGVINWNNGGITLTHSEVGKLAVTSTWVVPGATGRPFISNLITDVTLGGWANALKGYVDLGTTGGVTGVLSAICGEILMATTSISGTYAAMELEMVYGASNGSLAKPCFIYANTAGSARTDFDTYGDFLILGTGLSAGGGKMLSAATQTLRVGTGALGGTKKYIVLSAAENCLSLLGSPTSSIIIGGTPTTGINFTATLTEGIDFGEVTLSSDASRENSLIKFGTVSTQKEFTPTDQSYIFQLNAKIMTDLGASKRVIGHYNKLETGAALTSTRLKVNENYCVVGHAVEDAHVVYGELYYASGYGGGGVTNEGFGGAFTVDTDDGSTPTGLLYALKARIKGTNLDTTGFKHCAAYFLTESATWCNTRFTNIAAITNMISFNFAGSCANMFHISGDCDNVFAFPGWGTLPHDTTDIASGTQRGHLLLKVGGTQYGIPLYDHS